ncbi:MAG: type IVB secretion system coupling complex protein DotM/IcmP, partial [Gammaproteobacteria bacterium]
WSGHLNQLSHFIPTAKANHYANVTFSDVISVSNQVGSYITWPAVILLVAWAVLLYMGNVTAQFRKSYSMKTMVQAEKDNWPFITPIVGLNLVKEDINKGPWAMASTPMEFAKKHNLLIVEEPESVSPFLKSKSITTASINMEDARRVFALQLGPVFHGIDALPQHMKALFAAFAGRIAADRDGPVELLTNIARSSGGKLDFSGTDELLKKHRDNQIVQKIIKQHAYVLTVMASMLERSRDDGVVPCAEFLWLKPYDRRLWFVLDCVGRQTPFAEVAGVFAHWIAEKEFGRKLNVPMIENAVLALDIAVKEVIYQYDEDEA